MITSISSAGTTFTSSVMNVVQPVSNGRTSFPCPESSSEMVGLPCKIRIGVIEVGFIAVKEPFGFGLKRIDGSRAGTRII